MTFGMPCLASVVTSCWLVEVKFSKAGPRRGSLGVEYNGGCLSVSLEGSVKLNAQRVT